jgi:competence protein ComEC
MAVVSYKHFFDTRLRSALSLLVLVSLTLALVSWVILFLNTDRGELRVTMLDVGQGDALFIESPRGTQVLIDGGRGTAVLRELSKVMPFWDRSIDIVVATHPDADHIGGLVDVLERFEVEHILEASVQNDTPVFHAFKTALKDEGSSVVTPSRGTELVLDDSVVLTLLSREVVAASDTNDASIVMRLDYGETSFLFTGDASSEVERELLQFYDALDVDVLKVGHHGSDTSTSPEFVSAVSPDIALISVGADNSYGHPKREVLETLTAAGANVLRTDTDGTVQLVSDGTTVTQRRLGFFAGLLGI